MVPYGVLENIFVEIHDDKCYAVYDKYYVEIMLFADLKF